MYKIGDRVKCQPYFTTEPMIGTVVSADYKKKLYLVKLRGKKRAINPNPQAFHEMFFESDLRSAQLR